jgi:uncharacterized protein (DUF983 family)
LPPDEVAFLYQPGIRFAIALWVEKQKLIMRLSMTNESWKEYNCPNCSRGLTSFDLAEIYYTRSCPACERQMSIDAKDALSQTKSTTIFAIILMGLFVCVDGELVRFAGISDEVFKNGSPALQLLIILSVVLIGIISNVLIKNLSIKLLLKVTFNRLKLRGRI